MSCNYHYYQQAKNLIQQEELKNGTQHTILLNDAAMRENWCAYL